MINNDFRQDNDITVDVIGAKKPSVKTVAYVRKLQKSHRAYGRLKIVLAVSAGIAISILAVGIFLHNRENGPIPRVILSQVNFPLYYPTELPAGFSLDKNSFSETSGVVTYVINYDNGKKLIFNTQALPKDFDFDSFQGNGKKIGSSLGDAYVGSLGNNTVVSVATDKSWLFIGVPSPINTPAMEVILQHLKQAN